MTDKPQSLRTSNPRSLQRGVLCQPFLQVGEFDGSRLLERQVGNTTRQMQEAPQKSVFVWVNGHLDYPRQLAKSLGRDDLKIVSPDWLSDHRWFGLVFSGIVLDHAAALNDRQWDAFHIVRDTRVRS